MTTDVRFTAVDNTFDFTLQGDGDLTNGDFLDSSLQYSLLGEQRATASEVPVSEYRRGWIGNEDKDYENGSKIWLFEQARVSRTTLNGLQTAALNCLNWMITDGLLVNVEATAALNNGAVGLTIDLFRFNSKVDRRYFELWQNTGT